MINSLFSRHEALGKWYNPVLLDPETIAAFACSAKCRRFVSRVFGRLTPDAYSHYITGFRAEGERKFGDAWRYLDIVDVLAASALLIQPSTYLEIGVRRGRSIATVGAAAPRCSVVGMDLWMKDYAGMENPGPEFVQQELQRAGHRGSVEFISGNSHEKLPELAGANPPRRFSMITVDGDHSDEGARQDLLDVIPMLGVGGVIVFDDIAHPAHPNLRAVWRAAIADSGAALKTFEYGSLGYGVAFAVRVA